MKWLARLFGRRFNPDAAANEVAEGAKKALGGDLVGVLAYGSWVLGEYSPGHSDLNLMVVARRLDEAAMNRLSPMVKAWSADPSLKVLVFAQGDLKAFGQTFPMEFLDVAESRKLLAGEDPFVKLQVPQDRLAEELDAEIKNRVVKMRRRYLQCGGDAEAVKQIVSDTGGSLFTVLRAFVRLKKRKPPRQRVRLIEEACKLYRFSRRTLLQSHDLRYGRRNAERIDPKELYGRLMAELGNMADAAEKALAEGGQAAPAGGKERGSFEEGRESGGREGGGREGRESGRGRERREEGRDGRRELDSRGGSRQQKLGHVKQLIAEASQRKKWEPRESERFVSDDFTRDLSLSPSARFGWDRAWQPERRAKGYVPAVIEPEAPGPSEQEEFEAAEITAPDVDVNAPQPEIAAEPADLDPVAELEPEQEQNQEGESEDIQDVQTKEPHV